MCTFEFENIMNRGVGIDIVDVNYHFHKLFRHIQCDEYQINGNFPAKFRNDIVKWQQFLGKWRMCSF